MGAFVLIKTLKIMVDITRLSIWPELKALGFVRIRFRAHGKIVAIGAALQQEHISTHNKPFKSDIICIEPSTRTFSDNRNYHITGKIKTPYVEQLFRIDGIGRKEPIFEITDHMNEFFAARDILKTVKLMLK